MKKFVTLLLGIIMTAAAAFTLYGCADKDFDGQIEIYMPDGAPALAFSQLMSENNQLGREVSYHVVDSNSIGAYVANGTAEAALLPVNAASKLCGDGKAYKMLSVNTHGNLFVIGKGEAADISALKGKKIGVVNLPNVPGLTFKAILTDKGVGFTEDPAALTADNVLLLNIAGTELAARLNSTDENTRLDFAVAPEPAVSALTSKVPAIKIKFSLQELWGENGYPQAVLVAKTELCEDGKFVSALLDALSDSAAWLPEHAADAAEAVKTHLAEGLNPSFNANNLTAAVIANCNIKVVKAKDAQEDVKNYITKIKAISEQAAGSVTDEFFFA